MASQAQTLYLPYARQHITQEDIDAAASVLTKPVITRGSTVSAFEEAFANACGAAYAVAFNSGTAALMAAFAAAEASRFDTVLSTPNTFISTVGSAYQRGVQPLFIDIDPDTGNFDLDQLELNINREHSKGKTIVVPVHFAGIPVDMQAIDAMIRDPATVVIEDASHAIGSTYLDGTKVGSCRWSRMTTFSFHPAKTITTGEGGMVTTNDEELYHRLLLFRNNGIERDPSRLRATPRPGYYEVVTLSGNYNVTEMQAALGLSQLKRLDAFVSKRQALMDRYRHKLAGNASIRLLSQPESGQVAWHMCVVRIDFAALKRDKADIMEQLHQANIGTQVHFIPVYRHPFFVDLMGDISKYFPKMEQYYQEALTLPLFYDMTEQDVDRVVEAITHFLTPD